MRPRGGFTIFWGGESAREIARRYGDSTRQSSHDNAPREGAMPGSVIDVGAEIGDRVGVVIGEYAPPIMAVGHGIDPLGKIGEFIGKHEHLRAIKIAVGRVIPPDDHQASGAGGLGIGINAYCRGEVFDRGWGIALGCDSEDHGEDG